MASCILKRVLANSKCASTRGLCSRTPVGVVHSHVQDLAQSFSPSIVSLESSFSGAGDRNFHDSCCRGFGVCLDPTLVLTSAHMVGRISTFYEPRTLEKSDGFEHGSVQYESCIGSTDALTNNGIKLKTRPLAINFAHDVAVLEAVNPEGSLLPYCTLASSLPEKENILMAFAAFDIFMGNVRAVGKKTVRTKAPWPMEDDLGWIEHEWFFYGGGGPPPRSIWFNSREKVTGSVTRITGSPWFNLQGEVVGISSWEVRDEPAKFSVGYVAPSLGIKSALEYAKTKGPEDPIVMDHWIGSRGGGR